MSGNEEDKQHSVCRPPAPATEKKKSFSLEKMEELLEMSWEKAIWSDIHEEAIRGF